MQRSEQIASRRGDSDLAARINRTRRDAGAVDAAELPIRGYDAKGVPEVVAAAKRLRDPQLSTPRPRYEEANKHREGVVEPARARIEAFAASLAAAS